MSSLVKILGVSLLVLGLVGCDDAKKAEQSAPSMTLTEGKVSLLAGKVSFTLPSDMVDQSSKLNPPSDTKFIYTDPLGNQTVIVVFDHPSDLSPAEQAKQLISARQTREPDLKVISDMPLTISGKTLQQVELVTMGENQKKVVSTIVMGNVADRLFTLQIAQPAEDLPVAQKTAASIIASLQLN